MYLKIASTRVFLHGRRKPEILKETHADTDPPNRQEVMGLWSGQMLLTAVLCLKCPA